MEILLIEDNPLEAQLVIRTLMKLDHLHRLFYLEDSVDACDFIFGKGKHSARKPGGNIKLILLDLKLPKMDGLELLSKIKADPKTRNIPVVVLSSSNEDSDRDAALKLGVNGYMVKPIGYQQFQKKLTEVVSYWLLVSELTKGEKSTQQLAESLA
jgi:two-component system response regulator